MQWIYWIAVAVVLGYNSLVIEGAGCPVGWDDKVNVIFMKNNTLSRFALDIKPKRFKGMRDPYKVLILSSSFIPIIGREKIVISTKDGTQFMTNAFCVETNLVRNVLLQWFLNGKRVYLKKTVVQKPRNINKRSCIIPDNVDKTRADKVVVRIRRASKKEKEMTIKGLTLSVCFQPPLPTGNNSMTPV